MKINRIIALAIFLFTAQSIMANPLWMRYPAISPDGQTVVFSYKGDLYTVPSTGGEAKILTVHEAYDYRPVWSPDSKTIAFASNRHGNFDIFTIPASGGKTKRISYYSGNEYPTSFSPDGMNIIFSASIQDNPNNMEFPSRALDELYMISVNGGREKQILSTPARYAHFNSSGDKIVYHDNKSVENTWRKHNTQGFARDIWVYDLKNNKNTKLTDFKGDDRFPIFSKDNQFIYYLSEKFGDFNVCRFPLDNPSKIEQITTFENHPVRFLSSSKDGTLCFNYDGEIYTLKEGSTPQKINVQLNMDERSNNNVFMKLSSGATEMDVSPDGKEVVFIVRGEVFVTSVDYRTTKRITNTPEQERSVSFSPDGKSILYASERNGSWNLYQTKLAREEEVNFSNSTLLKEEEILASDKETFQPSYSPDGKEVAFLEERTILRVINLKTKKIRTILKGDYNYSYTDGDQHYDWSPDGKWFLVDFCEKPRWPIGDVVLVDASGNGKVTNLTQSGYSDGGAKWMMEGKAMIWGTDRHGFRSHGSWGAEMDVYAMYFTQEAFDRSLLSEEELAILKEKEKNAKKKEAEKEKKEKKKDDKKGDKKKEAKKNKKELEIDLMNIEDRKRRLTTHSSNLSDMILSKDGDELYYLSRFEKGYDLWVTNIRKNKTRLITKLQGEGGGLQWDKKNKYLFLFSGNRIIRIDPKSKKPKFIAYNAEFNLDQKAEKEYLFEHVWRQVKKKFYDAGMHGVDWDFYKNEYAKFIPYINNNYDFAEMLSELLGELNASHTGSGYRFRSQNGDATAQLGIFYDMNYTGAGIKILEVINKGPFTKAKSKVKAGDIIEKIDGVTIQPFQSFYPLLNHKAGKAVVLSVYDPQNGKRWDETIKPISGRKQGQLIYDRWVKIHEDATEKLSNGKIGYIHVQGMNSNSFRKTFSELLGRFFNKEAIIIDTRFNGGGWLHNDLVTLLSGKAYMKFEGRGTKVMGGEPLDKWYKPSAVIVNEGNYSDAHTFPYAYQTLGIGPIVGMPVPGTSTSVWWETLQDPSLYFGIPQVKNMNMQGKALENKEVIPEYVVDNEPDVVVTGRDQQLEKTVEVLLKKLKK